MRTYLFNDWDENDNHVIREITEDEILEDYWNYWNERMVKKFGYGHELITKDNCINDWIVVNWAWEKDNEST